MSSDLRSLIVYGLSAEARRVFWSLVSKVFCPPEIDVNTPSYVMADWYEERGEQAAADMLRACDWSAC